jgi:hypothetical protein
MDEILEIKKAALRRHPSMSGGERILLVMEDPATKQVQTLYLLVERSQAGDATEGVPARDGG